MSRLYVRLACGLIAASVLLPSATAAAQTKKQKLSDEVWIACTREARARVGDQGSATDRAREMIFRSCAENGGVMPRARPQR